MTDLADIVGQRAALDQLAGILAGGRLPHAFIFAGPAGVGRRTAAEALAKVLLCPHSIRSADALLPTACGRCDGGRAFEAGAHGDYHLINKELGRYSKKPEVRARKMQSLGIEVVREFVIAPANQAAVLGRGKVFVVREAELMNAEAQNALLKTLEEPPPGVTLILLCGSPQELLATTRSRCALVRFGRLEVSFVADRLVSQGLDASEARFWAAYTQGSLGESLRLSAGGLYATKREMVDRLAAMEAGEADLADWLAKQAEALADAAVAADRLLARSLAGRRAAAVLLGLLASVYRDVLRRSAGSSAADIHADQADAIDRLAEGRSPSIVARIITQLAEYERLLWRNVNPKTVWDNVTITCATAAPLEV